MESGNLTSQITALILAWRLDEAATLIEKTRDLLPGDEIQALLDYLEQYREWKTLFSDAETKIESDPVGAQYILNLVPEEIRVTYPDLESLHSAITAAKERFQIQDALDKCEEASNFILNEVNGDKALEAIEAAKRAYPNWDRVPELREKISAVSEIQEKLSKGLQIQLEVSELREKGGQSAYQHAIALINEYTALGLETLGIVLFDVDLERENLLKMITRAEGESWSHRLAATSESEETLRLEQSIRSLEDAESKNLRVLYNNNSRLLILLSEEQERTAPDSEEGIQLTLRIDELRRKNQRLETEIRAEVARRAGEYAGLAKDALEIGELGAAESNLRLARDAGVPGEDSKQNEYLGTVDLPTAMIDQLAQLEAQYRTRLSLRQEVEADYQKIREEYSRDENFSLNNLFSWKNAVETLYEQDPKTPGLVQFRRELDIRYQSVRSYAFEKGLHEIERFVRIGDISAARNRLDALNAIDLGDDEKEILRKRFDEITRVEEVFERVHGLRQQINDLYQAAAADLQPDPERTSQIESLYGRITAIYAEQQLPEPQDLETTRFTQTRNLREIETHQDNIFLIKKSVAEGVPTAESIAAAETLENTALFSLDPVRELLSRFWFFCAKAEKTPDLQARYLEKAERIAESGSNEKLHQEIHAFQVNLNAKNAEGQHVNLVVESLTGFVQNHNYLAGIDYISKNLTAEDRRNPQIFQLTERIEQAYRFDQSGQLLKQAKEAFAAGDYQEAEEAVNRSLDFFYSIEAAQLQKSIEGLQQVQENSLRAVEEFLNKTIPDEANFGEDVAEEIRSIAERVDALERSRLQDYRIRSRVLTARNRLEKFRSQDQSAFLNLRQQFENNLLVGEEGLETAAEILDRMESRVWIDNRSEEISALKAKLDEIKNSSTALTAVIQQADAYLKQGDFRSAERLLTSFRSNSSQDWPDWLLIRKENAEFRIHELREKYRQVQARFDQDGGVVSEMNRILDPKNDALADSFRLSTELGQYQTILERDINVDAETNSYTRSIKYLLDVLRWNEVAAEVVSGSGTRQNEPSLDALYGIRKSGRDLFDRMPPNLVGIQPGFAERNKWLEQRTRVRQLLVELTEKKQIPGKTKAEQRALEARNVAELEKMDLRPEERETIRRFTQKLEKSRKRKGCIWTVVVLFLLTLAGLYLAAPKLIPLLTPQPTTTHTPVISETPSPTLTETTTPTPTLTHTATITLTPTLTLTPTATLTLTPTPMGLRGVVRNKIIAVYELPDGYSSMLSEGYLPTNSEVEVIRYCEKPYNKGEYWALIYYPSAVRNTGWIKVIEPGSPDFVSFSTLGQPSADVLDDNLQLRMDCPTLPYLRMPGDESIPTAAPTATNGVN